MPWLALKQSYLKNIAEHHNRLEYTSMQHITRHSLMLTEQKGDKMAENIIATWRTPGIFKADAQKVCNELRDLCEDISGAKPRQIVDRAAMDESSELHKCFTWDNDEAADKWRLHQAVQLTSELIFKREVREDGTVPPPVRIFNKTDSAGGYKIPERTFNVQSEYEALLQRALAELHAFKIKYAALKELDYILELID